MFFRWKKKKEATEINQTILKEAEQIQREEPRVRTKPAESNSPLTQETLTEEQKQEIFETVELPALIKNKAVPTIVGQNDKPLLARKPTRVWMHYYIFNILVKRNSLEDICKFFQEDSVLEDISIFDNSGNRIIFYMKRHCAKGGLFIVPMRYEDEDEDSEVTDGVMHYTLRACSLVHKNDPTADVKVTGRNMHFYTSVNQQTSKTYLPAFTSLEECQALYPPNKYRYCTASYDDLIERANQFSGIALNPLGLNMVLDHAVLKCLAWINLELKQDRQEEGK